MTYTLRAADHADRAAIIHHRIAMFTDMGIDVDTDEMTRTFGPWLDGMMEAGVYRAWLIESPEAGVVSGGGISILPWPPGPHYAGGRLAFVYNMYTEPPHRGRGLARRVLTAIHEWCAGNGITSVGLNASRAGRPLYESMGYAVAESPMMFRAIEAARR